MQNKLERCHQYLSHLIRAILPRRSCLKQGHQPLHKAKRTAGLLALLLLSIGVGAQQAKQIITLKNIQITKVGVSIANLQLNLTSLAVGQTIGASYQYSDTTGGGGSDASVYLWGVKGTTAAQINTSSQTISQSGQVPGRTLVQSDVGSILEVSVQARNTLNKKGNTLTVATDSLGLAQGGTIYDGSISSSINNLILSGQLSVGQVLSATYQFNANGGNTFDKTTYRWGVKGDTAGQVASGGSVASTGIVPSYTIKPSDAGKILEL